MNLVKEIELYHGTCKSRFNNILEKGFNSSYKDYNLFLAAKGIYFVADRPSVAYRFAKSSAFESIVSDDVPIIFKIKLKNLKNNEILDLTTDFGLNIFWKEYHRAYKAFKNEKNQVTKNLEKQYPDYFKFLEIEKTKTITEEFIEYFKKFLPDFKPNKTNIDSFVLDWLTRNFKVIIAAIQEGNPFQYQLFRNRINYESIPAYKGVRFRDHIEICITNTNCIDISTIEPLEIDKIQLENDFLNYVTHKGDDIL